MRSKNNQDESLSLVEEDNQISRRTLWTLLAGVFLISFSLLAFEITLTRLLSVVLSYHYVFVVFLMFQSSEYKRSLAKKKVISNVEQERR